MSLPAKKARENYLYERKIQQVEIKRILPAEFVPCPVIKNKRRETFFKLDKCKMLIFYTL